MNVVTGPYPSPRPKNNGDRFRVTVLVTNGAHHTSTTYVFKDESAAEQFASDNR